MRLKVEWLQFVTQFCDTIKASLAEGSRGSHTVDWRSLANTSMFAVQGICEPLLAIVFDDGQRGLGR